MTPFELLEALLSRYIKEIMSRESVNTNTIHLYNTGDYWVSFEKSAYMLQRLSSDVDTATINHPAYPFPIIMSTVAESELTKKCVSLSYKNKQSGYVAIPTSEITLSQYTKWHKNEIEDLVEEEELTGVIGS